ncbi:MAG: lysophospholipid acyltransferase family protein [Nitrospirota bacterium]
MKKAVWLFEVCLFIILSIPLAILPFKWSMKAGELLGLLVFYLWGSRRRIAIENIKESLLKSQESNPPESPHTPLWKRDNPPQSPFIKGGLEGDFKGGHGGINYSAEGIARETFKNLGRSLVEIIKIYYGYGEKIISSVDIEGIENFDQAKSKGKGILFLTGHCGNWELMAIATSVKLGDAAIVARPINNPYVNKFIENVRQKYGNRVIYKQKALKPIIQILKNNGSVGILIDQSVIPDEGYVIDFLGRGAWTTKMPALIARKTGAAVLPVFIHRTDGGHRIKIYPEVELSKNGDIESAVLADTKKFSHFIEEYIRAHPSEWLWIHRRWKRV